jgi:hypothetical protein
VLNGCIHEQIGQTLRLFLATPMPERPVIWRFVKIAAHPLGQI